MFKVVTETLVWWPVTFPGVTEEGEIVENKIEMRFVVLDEDAIDDFKRTTAVVLAGQSEEGGDQDVQVDAERRPSALMQRTLAPIVRDWRLVAGANGEPMPFNTDNFRALLRVPNIFAAILAAYGACRAGRAEVRAGN